MHNIVDYITRHVLPAVMDALQDTRVVIINGARQVGKSTLAGHVLKRSGGVVRHLDDAATRTAAQDDPAGFVGHDGLMLIDDVQRVPDLWLAIKHSVDRDPTPGRFLLTGSARLLALKSIPDSLPGRSETVELWPLSQGEIDGYPDGFVDAAFRLGSDVSTESLGLNRKDYLDRAERGGYPDAFRRDTPRRRSRFFASYLADVVTRDVVQVAEIVHTDHMRRLITLLAAQTCGLVNTARLAGELGLSAPTVRTYLQILETIYLIRLIPAWSADATTRAVATPKVMFVDSGFAWHLGAQTGPLLENFVLGELARQLTWSDTSVRLHHFRDRDQHEVDAILENNAGRIVGIEVKAAETVRSHDFANLRLLQKRLGDRFHCGFVLYCGDQSLSFGDRLVCLPISALWTSSG